MVESMYHLRRINFQCFVINNNNNNKLEGNGTTAVPKSKISADEELNDADEPSKNPFRTKSTYILLVNCKFNI